MIQMGTTTATIALNIMSLIVTVFLILICIIVLSALTCERPKTVVIILVMNNYFALFTFSIVSLIMNIEMLRGDYHWSIRKNNLTCRLEGFTLYALIGVIFNSFALHAVFRFIRVIYPMRRCLRYFRNYFLIIVSIWFLSFLLLLPIHFWQDIQLNPDESVCLLVLNSPRGFIWTTIIVYGIPMAVIISIYVYLIRAVGNSLARRLSNIKQDMSVVRRIVVVIIILTLICAPSIILELFLPFIHADLPSYFFRISNVTMVIAMLLLSLMLIYVTPKVKESLSIFIPEYRVRPLDQQQRLATIIAAYLRS